MLLTQRFTRKQRSGFWATCRANLCMTFQGYKEPRVVHTRDGQQGNFAVAPEPLCQMVSAQCSFVVQQLSMRAGEQGHRFCKSASSKQQALVHFYRGRATLVVGAAGPLVASFSSLS